MPNSILQVRQQEVRPTILHARVVVWGPDCLKHFKLHVDFYEITYKLSDSSLTANPTKGLIVFHKGPP